MINRCMDIFATLLVIAMLVMLGNIARLAACTYRVWFKQPGKMDRFKAIILLLSYCAVTAPFMYCAILAICEIWACGSLPGASFIQFK
jgi:hypothetical protein